MSDKKLSVETEIKEIKKRRLAVYIEDLPLLREDYARAVHLTSLGMALDIADTGLNYEKYGSISSVARYWENASEVDYRESDDLRFKGEHIRAVILDIPANELRLHDGRREQMSEPTPGTVPAKYVVGIVKPLVRT